VKSYVVLAALAVAVWQIEMAVQCAVASVRRPRPFVKQQINTPAPQCENGKCPQPQPIKK
jgi:hypothetical protein